MGKHETPPLALPYGAGREHADVQTASEIATTIPIHFSLESALRTAFSDLFSPATLLTISIMSAFMAALLIGSVPTHGAHWLRGISPIESWLARCTIFLLLIVVVEAFGLAVFVRRFEVTIQQSGIYVHSPKWKRKLIWDNIIWVVHFNGYIWGASWARTCLLPRECFASRKITRKFADNLQRLQETNGAAWEATFGQMNSMKS